jgi:hypothetical protein
VLIEVIKADVSEAATLALTVLIALVRVDTLDTRLALTVFTEPATAIKLALTKFTEVTMESTLALTVLIELVKVDILTLVVVAKAVKLAATAAELPKALLRYVVRLLTVSFFVINLVTSSRMNTSPGPSKALDWCSKAVIFTLAIMFLPV